MMKRLILIFILILSSNLHAYDTWFCNKEGSDDNGGTSWADAKLTNLEVMSIASAGDTIVIGRGYIDETISVTANDISGVSTEYCTIVVDSLNYANKTIDDFTYVDFLNNPFTFGSFYICPSRAFIKIVGFSFVKEVVSTYHGQVLSSDIIVQKCAFVDTTDILHTAIMFVDDANDSYFRYCSFYSKYESTINQGIKVANYRHLNLDHCTIVGSFLEETINTDYTKYFKNNIIVNYGKIDNDLTIQFGSVGNDIDNMDYNIYYSNLIQSYVWRFYTDYLESTEISDWQGYIQTYFLTGESHAMYGDAELDTTNSSLSISSSSIAFDAASDSGNIGFYQVESSSSKRQVIIF